MSARDLAPPAFAMGHTDGHLWRRYRRQHRAALAAAHSAPLDLGAHAPQALAQAAIGWTTMAFNEYRAAATMAQVAHAMTLAQAPFDLTAAACAFPAQELHHAHLCAILAARLGGAPPSWRAEPITVATPPARTSAARWAQTLVVVHLCVAESISFALLKAALAAAHDKCSHPVLKVLCRDEALHAELGWAYLDWAAPNLCDAERAALSAAAQAAVEGYRDVWRPTRGTAAKGEDDALFSLCLLTPQQQVAVGEQAIVQDVRRPLAAYGVCA